MEQLPYLAEKGDGWEGGINKGEAVLRLGFTGTPARRGIRLDLDLGSLVAITLISCPSGLF